MLTQIEDRIARRHWTARTASGGKTRHWWTSPRLAAHYSRRVCGEGLVPYAAGAVRAMQDRYPGRVFKRAVSVGCGNASKEMRLLEAGLVEQIDLFEISASRITQGQALLAQKGLATRARFHDDDVFARDLDGCYDLVFWSHSLHHMMDVRAAVAWSRRVLRPGGVLVIDDYIGPSRLQWTPAQVDTANAFIAEMAAEADRTLGRVRRATPLGRARMYLKDPSEAPQSHLIQDACRRELDGFQLSSLGGAIIHICAPLVLALANGDEDHPLLGALIEADTRAEAAGHVHFAFGIWDKPAA